MSIARNGLGALAVGLTLLSLQACNTTPPNPIVGPPPSSPAARQQFRATRPSAAPTKALARVARTEQRAGHSQQAAASVERALRIDPYDPDLWHALALIRLQQGDAAQAEVMAAKSNSIARDDPDLQRDNWTVIARARRLNGDEPGAREAERRALAYD